MPLPPMPKAVTNEDFLPLEPPQGLAKEPATEPVKEPEKRSGSGA